MTRHALFLDRDGTLIVDTGYPRDPALVELLPGVVPPLLAAAAKGWALVIVSNQSGVARGLVTRDEAARVQARVEELFAEHGVRFDGVYFCFHEPGEECRCRKPAPGMLLDAAKDLGLDPHGSVMIGDKPSDREAGRTAGCHTVAFGPGAGADADAHCATWAELGAWLSGPEGPLGPPTAIRISR
jgi:D-glycero-D-manno-heptose 1,7-bisphosphate phosphatase